MPRSKLAQSLEDLGPVEYDTGSGLIIINEGSITMTNEAIQQLADSLVDDGLRGDLSFRLGEFSGLAEKYGRRDATMAAARLVEALSDQDWTKMGAVFGLLWYKFDKIIQAVEKASNNTQQQDRNFNQAIRLLTDISSKLSKLA